MRAYRSWRYRCDHCKKVGGSKFHMANHEKGCTMRPDRICGLCDKGGLAQKPIVEILAALDTEGFKAMCELVENCPACILAGLRQSLVTFPPEDGRYDWDFKKAKDEWWAELRSCQDHPPAYASGHEWGFL